MDLTGPISSHVTCEVCCSSMPRSTCCRISRHTPQMNSAWLVPQWPADREDFGGIVFLILKPPFFMVKPCKTWENPRHFWWLNPNKSSDIMTFALGCFSCFRWDGHMGISKWPIRRCSNASVRLCRTTLWPWRHWHGIGIGMAWLQHT